MHALHQMAVAAGRPQYDDWARELAAAAHRAFVVRVAGRPRQMYWKMSIDLSRPLTPSMGQHDPLDGLITYEELRGAIASDELRDAIADFAELCMGRSWLTDDPLGLGGLLWDAWRLGQLIQERGIERLSLLEDILDASLTGLVAFSEERSLERPAAYRLAFRELGLSIGLHALEKLRILASGGESSLVGLQSKVNALTPYLPLADAIEAFWLDAAHRTVGTWADHEDINAVMLAASLVGGLV
jgi:hypothetical protein